MTAGRLLAAALLCATIMAAPALRAADDWTIRPVEFASPDGVVLRGSVVTSARHPPVAAVVLVHGSGPATRYTALAQLMALGGIATLTYDKRGVGASGGRYEGEHNVRADNLRLLGADAAAAMAALRGIPDLRTLPRGYVGISQAGWVIPFALAEAPAADFVGFWSGPACTVSEQLAFQKFAETRGFDRARMAEPEIADVLARVTPHVGDVDPLQLLNAPVPVKWLYGGRDPYVPIALSIARLQARIDAGQRNWAFEVFPDEGHDLADSRDQPSFDAMIEWIRRTAATMHTGTSSAGP